MESIKQLYKIGHGPSSSHTMGPLKAAQEFGSKYNNAAGFEVTLYGSLAGTGKGHMTDVAILDALNPIASTSIVWQPDIFLPFHPNGMRFRALDAAGKEIGSDTVYSIGGGDILHEGEERRPKEEVYGMSKIADILAWAEKSGRSFWEYVELNENSDVWDYLREVWQVMREA
ncbi:MAG: serine dehydratase, partial [Duncaniella sp.]|nr:serine dehydratase [Duncaniella sp.]